MSRPTHIEDFLAHFHPYQWFGWSDAKNKIYANLQLTPEYGVDGEMVSNPRSLPTEQECIDGLVQIQAKYDKRATDKASGNQKLKDLGLTDDEIAAITKG
jgi:hypothetical protein